MIYYFISLILYYSALNSSSPYYAIKYLSEKKIMNTHSKKDQKLTLTYSV